MKRVLVTGATGLIGSRVCDMLLARGDEVVGLSRDLQRARETNPTVSWHAWNPAGERPPGAAFTGVEAVINLVGEQINQRLTDEAKQRIRDSRVRATKNLVDAMLAVTPTPGILVSQSTVGYYGERGEAIVDESIPPDDKFLSNVVVDWERAATAAEQGGTRVAILRTGLVLDPEGGLLKQLMLPFKLGVGGPLAGGNQYMPWIHRDDEVGLLLWALDNPQARGIFNATAPNPVTNRAFSKAFGIALRRPAFVPAPKFVIEAMRGPELTEQIVASMRVVPRRALDDGYVFRFTEIEPALRDLISR